MCHYLAIKCLLEAKEYNEALQVINDSEICTNITQSGMSFTEREDLAEDAPKHVILNHSYIVVSFIPRHYHSRF